MVKKSRPSQSHTQSKSAGDKEIKIPKLGGGGKGGDILGQHHRFIKQVDNNVIYGAGALLLLGGGYYAYSNGWLNHIPFISSLFTSNVSVPTNVMVTPNQIPQGQTATAVGAFSPTAATTYYAVYNSVGTSVLNGTLGTSVSSFSTPLATQSLPQGTYTIVVSDAPITGPPPGAVTGTAGQAGAPGQVLGVNQQLQDNFVPTGTTLNNSAGPQNTGASGPSNITLG